MDEKNGVDVGQEKVALEEENLQNEEKSSEEQSPNAAALDEPAADSSSPEDSLAEGDAKAESDPPSGGGENPAEVNKDEQAALLNQEDMVDESADDAAENDADDVDSGSSGLLSQEDIDNALQQDGNEDAVGEESMSQEEIDAAINNAVGELNVNDFGSTEHQPKVKEADFQQLSSNNKDAGQRNIDLLMDVELPVSIELGKTRMDISDILALGPGSVVELEKLVGEPVDLLVNNKCVARGEVVVVEENFGLRITQLISPEERIKNLQ